MVRKLKHLIRTIAIKLWEHTYEGRLKYLFQKHDSNTLIVVFSGFDVKPLYTYVRTLLQIKCDKMFILDDFGCRGSYYWYENGDDKPMRLVKSLITTKLNEGKYKRLITLGTSKGGTCAIYFGLMFGACDIYAGSCQYRIGTYLRSDEPVFKAMMGIDASDKERDHLDKQMPRMLSLHQHSPSKIHLFYSKDEHTYQDDIQFLISDLDKYNITHEDTISHFTNHGDVGKYFSPWIKARLTEI